MEKDFFDASAVNDLETARLALRWALEKVHVLQDESAKSRTVPQDAVEKLRLAGEQIAQKDAAILRWQNTIKVWEANWKDQQRMEEEIRERLKKELVREEDAASREARRQLELQIEDFKRQLSDKESLIGGLRRDLIDAVKNAVLAKEKEMQSLLDHQQRALDETKQALLDRLDIQAETIRAKERDLDEQQRLLDEKIRGKEAEFRRKYQQFEEELA